MRPLLWSLLPIFISSIATAEKIDTPWLDVSRLIESKSYQEAINLLNESLNQKLEVEEKVEILYKISFIYSEYLRDYEKALNEYNKAINIAKEYVSSYPDLTNYIILGYMSIANTYRRMGNYDEAIKMYRKVESEYPKTDYAKIARKNASSIESALNDIQLYEQIINDYPDTHFAAVYRLEIAELYASPQALNTPERAIKEYRKLIEQYPDSEIGAEALLRIGNIYSRILSDPVRAVSAYQKIIEGRFSATKLGAEAAFGMGMVFYNSLRNYSKASEVFKLILTEYPTYRKYPAVLYWLGMCYEQVKDYDKAIETFVLLYQTCPDKDTTWLADIGKFGDKDIKKEIKAKIDNLKTMASSAYWAQIEQALSKDDYIKALSLCKELIVKYPESEYAEKSKQKLDEINYMAEIQACKKRIRRKEVSAPSAQFRIAEIYETNIQDYQQAIREYQKLYQRYADTDWGAEALYRIGCIYALIGLDPTSQMNKSDIALPDYERAIETFRKIVKEYPDTITASEAQYQIGEIYYNHLKAYEQAVNEYETFLNKYPRRNYHIGDGYKDSLADEAQFKVGKIYYENLKDYEKALQVFEKIAKSESCRKAAAYSYIADIQEKRNNIKGALSSLQQIIRLISDSDIQAEFFLMDSLYAQQQGFISLESDLQQSIAKQINSKISLLNKR